MLGIVLAAVTVTEHGARQAAESGPLAALTWVILALIVVFAATSAALMVQLGRQGRALKESSDANRTERLQMAEDAKAERREMASQHNELIGEVLKLGREFAGCVRDVAVTQHADSVRLITRLEERPCLVGARLGNGEPAPAPASGPGGER